MHITKTIHHPKELSKQFRWCGAVLQDESKKGTFVNDMLLGIDMKIGLKNGYIIGLAYFTKDMARKISNAFKFSVQESNLSPNKSFPTLIESS